ncbi:MAG TPA: phage holin family protein [Candidatus Limnocylindrales bacterium]
MRPVAIIGPHRQRPHRRGEPETPPLSQQPNASDPTAPGAPASGPTAADEAAPSTPPTPGLREQLGRTKDALLGLVQGHVDLARAEFADIVDEVKRVAVLAGLALGLLLFAGTLLSIGSTLWLGEWLFGSMGWGVLLGTQLSVAIALVLVVRAVDPESSGGGALVGALVLGVVVAALFGLHLPNAAWDSLGASVAPDLAPATRPLVVGLVAIGAVGAILGLLAGGRGAGFGGAVAGLVLGAILGAAIGAFSAITFPIHVAVAVGIAVALLFWPLFAGLGLARHGIDTEALKARFWPDVTISTTKETIEWAREQTPLGRKS